MPFQNDSQSTNPSFAQSPISMRPLIGITIHPTIDPDRANLDRLVADIVEGVERAGGLPLLVPLGLSESTLRDLSSRLAGLLLSGGGDIEPERYHAPARDARLGGLCAERDRTELLLTGWALAEQQPLFGICRGAQLLNVALGGTLYQDVSEHPGAIRHTFSDEDFANRPHAVKVAEESRLARILKQPLLDVNSLHHQAIRDVAPALQAVAHAPDGLVEAVELPDAPFALAVQWHPECLLALPEHQALFDAFVAAADQRTSRF